ncbi:MAG: hypothetical protein ACYTFZ_02535 [Planctomycetota bacterium]|jgi:hypothetical protein
MRKPYVGIWLDHRQAYLIWVDKDGRTDCRRVQTAYRETEEKGGRVVSGAAGVYGGLAPHVHLEEKRQREAKRFYDRICKAIRNAEEVFIFGPGQAKRELRRRLEEHKAFDGRVRAVKGAEKMTERQMTARVREFFGLPHPAKP